MKLKIFTIGGDAGGYGDGLCVIAANNADEASKIAKDGGWRQGDNYPNEIKGAFFEGEPCVLDGNYYQE